MEMTHDSYNFKVTWQPFLLRPNFPPEGVPKPQNSSGSQRLVNIGKQVEIDFTYKCDRYPNTLLGHCALEYALEKDPTGKIQNDVQEKLFKSYFTDGQYPSADVVSNLAGECGLSVGEVKYYIENPVNQERTREKALKNSQDGITGVPFFVINGQGMISGAQEPETLVKTFAIAHSKFPLPSSASSS